MKNLISVFFLLAIVSMVQAQPTGKGISSPQSFPVGGVSVILPVPDTSFVEVGSSNRTGMEVFVPQSNRLLGAYVLKTDFPQLYKAEGNSTMERYALVEVPREAESVDCGPDDFKEVTTGATESLGPALAPAMKESEDEFNNRMKSMDISNMQVKIGEPKQLGVFYSKEDMLGMGLLVSYEIGGTPIRMAMTIMLIRAKQRLIFVYLYSEFKSEDTIVWLRRVGEKWGDEILKANR
ncbi:MAG: hypothetical protein U0X39_05705 [Bacteroidales bacterium]